VGSGTENDRERRGHWVDAAEDRLELVGPAGVVDEHVGRRVHVGALGPDVGRARLERLAKR
jgi:hypothetical protein